MPAMRVTCVVARSAHASNSNAEFREKPMEDLAFERAAYSRYRVKREKNAHGFDGHR